jgi:small subunit ribosomal protein S17
MPKRTLQGVVVSDKQDKTVVVRADNTYAVGDMVWIEERRPLSKLKCWEVVRGEKKQRV